MFLAGLMVYSVGIIGEYISQELSEKLLTHLGLDAVKLKAHKRKSTVDATALNVSKRCKDDLLDESLEDIRDVKTAAKPVEKKVSAKEKAMVKAASGSKNIMSFFKKK